MNKPPWTHSSTCPSDSITSSGTDHHHSRYCWYRQYPYLLSRPRKAWGPHQRGPSYITEQSPVCESRESEFHVTQISFLGYIISVDQDNSYYMAYPHYCQRTPVFPGICQLLSVIHQGLQLCHCPTHHPTKKGTQVPAVEPWGRHPNGTLLLTVGTCWFY